jgi:hypothetical protein
LKLILGGLLVVHTSLYRSAHADIGIEHGSAIDLATSPDIELRTSSATAMTSCEARNNIETGISILSSEPN